MKLPFLSDKGTCIITKEVKFDIISNLYTQFSIELDSSNDDTYDVKEFNTFSLGVREKVIDMETSKDSLFVATRKRVSI